MKSGAKTIKEKPVNTYTDRKLTRAVTKRFLEAKKEVMSDSILNDGDYSTDKDFCSSVKMYQEILRELKAGTRNITIENGVLLCKVHGYSGEWLFVGRGKKKVVKINGSVANL